jgi:uncharacterized protein (TIGR03435 family)
MRRFRLATIIVVLGLRGLFGEVSAQAPARPTFDVASVKVNKSGQARTDGALAGTRFSMINETLARLIGEAYAAPQTLTRNRIIGGPDWLDGERFDVQGVALEPLTRERARLMLQTMLADRFQLKVHTEVRQLPVFNMLMVRDDGRLGPKLRRSETDCGARPATNLPPASAPNDVQLCTIRFGFGSLAATGVTMADLATMALSRVAGRPTIDHTGLTGMYDWTLVWTPDNLPPRAGGTLPGQPLLVNGIAVDPDGPPLSTAIQEQLGLKLQSSTGPVDVLVIDRVERPAPD